MIIRCFDKIVISEILNNPKVRDWLTDDNSPVDYEAIIHPQIIYLMNDAKTGVIRVDPMNSISCSVHIATLPELWGHGSQFAKEAIEWGFKNTLYQKVVAMIPAYNEKTLSLVKKLGFIQEGILRKAFLKRWVLHDMIIFGLNKGGI